MIRSGDTIGAATVWLETGEAVEFDDLLEDGPVLVLFYLFDWSRT